MWGCDFLKWNVSQGQTFRYLSTPRRAMRRSMDSLRVRTDLVPLGHKLLQPFQRLEDVRVHLVCDAVKFKKVACISAAAQKAESIGD